MELTLSGSRIVKHLLNYCEVHRNCISCLTPKSCKKLQFKILRGETNMTEEDLMMILILRDYCHKCRLCPSRCEIKTSYQILMWRIVADHKKKYSFHSAL